MPGNRNGANAAPTAQTCAAAHVKSAIVLCDCSTMSLSHFDFETSIPLGSPFCGQGKARRTFARMPKGRGLLGALYQTIRPFRPVVMLLDAKFGPLVLMTDLQTL